MLATFPIGAPLDRTSTLAPQRTGGEGELGQAMKIAILGWGSLLWEKGGAFDQWHGEWQRGGPFLKLEFSRISRRRLGALTLVIDDEHGTPTVVSWCLSKRKTVDDAICDLRCREETTIDKIGRIVIPGRSGSASGGGTEDALVAWTRSKNLDAVIWTALKSNFRQKQNQSFSLEAALSYLKVLDPQAKSRAAEYVWRAPDFVKTPLRSELQREPWFSER
jgi:hypothetical protein